MNKQEKIEKVLQSMNDNETNRKKLINIFDYVAYNDNRNNGMIDYAIENMDYIDEMAYGMKPIDILNEFSRVNINDDYLYFNGTHYTSGNAYEAIKENIIERCFDEDIAEYIIEHDEDFDVDEIRNILDGEL
jgi:hypothetical protein